MSQHVEYIAFGEVLFEEHSSSFKSPYLFNGKELDRETNLTNFGARYLDMKTSLWLNVDPLAEKTPSVSSYVYCAENPINLVDPDGRSGEPVINKRNKTITVHSNVILYGGKASSELAKSTASDIQNAWNSANGKVTIEGVSYSVKFAVTGIYNDKLSESDVNSNTDIKNNYIRTEETVAGGISYMDDAGSNSGYFLLKNITKDGSTTEGHEFGHGFGLEHPVDTDLRGDSGAPGIMNPRGTIVNPEYQYNPNAVAGQKNGTINPETRKVNQTDINNLGLDKINYDRNGKGKLGKLTNTYHEKTQ
ncbi:RHS repeat-associated core domain-containing protein [Flavobacterium psychrophilum]|nr:RHS repeat-associated core domain-containing protein [Flavobacterium psychrophilum]